MRIFLKTFFRIGFLVFIVFICSGCIKNTNANTFIVANGITPPVLNPAHINTRSDERICRALFEGLVLPDAITGDAIPALAQSWQFDSTCRSITFSLRYAEWSDGKKITAQNVVDSYFYLMENCTNEENKSLLAEIIYGARAYMNKTIPKEEVGLKAIDDHTLRIDFSVPRADAVQLMASNAFVVLPTHVILENPTSWAEPSNIVTNGAFKVANLASDGTLTLIANNKYWNKDSVSLARIIFLNKEASEKTFKDFNNGKISWIPDIPFEKIESIKDNVFFIASPTTAIHYYYLNVNHKVLCNPKVRQALNLAINKIELVNEVLKGNGEPSASLILARSGWKEVQSPEFDVEKAKKLLAECDVKSKDFDETILAYNEENEIYKKTAEFVAMQLKENLNISVNIQSDKWNDFVAKRRANGFDIARGGWHSSLNEPTNFLLQLVSTDAENAGRYNNQFFDAFLRSANRSSNNAERYALLRQAEFLAVVEDVAVIPLYFEKTYQLINTKVWSGWYTNPADVHIFSTIKLNDVDVYK
ncbi:MAG: peptide ABC transporter substrate-binding protein [Treponema sp.]|nr:peptide ABC transporter substrate-binding protein [Treponema sp.]